MIPTLGEAPEVGPAVASAWAAGCERLPVAEVVVADGGSGDRTVDEAIAAGARVVASRPGRGLQLRAGVAETTGQVVLMLHADSRLPRGAGEQIARAIDAGARVGFFRQTIDAGGWLYRLIERGNAWRGRRLRLPYGDQAIFLRRDLLEELGGVPPLPLMEDVALMQRARRVTRPVMLDGPLRVSARRWRRHGVIKQTARNWTLLAAFLAGTPAERLVPKYTPHAGVAAAGSGRPSLGGAGRGEAAL